MKLVVLLVAGGLVVLPATALAVTSWPAQPATISMSGVGAPKCTTLKYHLVHKVKGATILVGNVNARYLAKVAPRNAGTHTLQWCGVMHRDSSSQPVKISGTFNWRVYTNLVIHHSQGNRLSYDAVTAPRNITVIK